MVEDILEVNVVLSPKEGLLAPQHSIEDVAKWGDGAPQIKQLLLDRKNFMNCLGSKFAKIESSSASMRSLMMSSSGR